MRTHEDGATNVRSLLGLAGSLCRRLCRISNSQQPDGMGSVLSADAYKRLALHDDAPLSLLDLVASSDAWIHRRVESVAFYDNTTVAYRVSVDLTIPDVAPVVAPTSGGVGLRLLPVTMLRKEPLANLDVRDASGRSLPILTSKQNSDLSLAMLLVWARSILQGDVPEPIVNDLDRLVRCSAAEASRAYVSLEEGPAAGADAERAILFSAAEESFAALANDLSEHFVFIVGIAAEPGERHVLKFSYDVSYQVGPYASVPRRIAERLGLAASSVEFELVAPVPAASHHFEVVKPPDVDVAYLTATRPGADKALRVEGGAQHVHAHLGQVLEGEAVAVTVGLLAERRGWLRGCWATATAITALLVFLAVHLPVVTPIAEDGPRMAASTGAPLLLAVAGLAASLLNRPREHALATDLLWVLRLVVAAPPLAAFGLAAALTVGPPRIVIPVVCWVLTAVSASAAAVVTVAVWWPWTRPPG